MSMSSQVNGLLYPNSAWNCCSSESSSEAGTGAKRRTIGTGVLVFIHHPVLKSGDLPTALLQRKAVVYIRQSSPNQVINNPESQRRQYELVEAARHHGFRDVETIDDDLGRTASGMEERPASSGC